MFSDTVAKPCQSQNTIDNSCLFYKNRKPEINHSIFKAFERISIHKQSSWGMYNGNAIYGIGAIKEHKLLKKVIQQSPSENKHFYALDIGAGNYEWGRELAAYLNRKKTIPKDVTIHIIGVRGETNLDKEVTEIGQCKLYEFGHFPIEKLEEELEKRNLQLLNKIDLIVSRWCFRHLVDPVGTFTQAYDLLRPKDGHLLLDGFFFLGENEKMSDKSINFNDKMTRLCLETNAPFLTRSWSDTRSLDHFIVNKLDDKRCHLEKQYLGLEHLNWGHQIGSEAVTQFKELNQKNKEAFPLLYDGEYRGDKTLYESLRQKGLLNKSEAEWGPLQGKDVHKKTPALHIAIASGDQEAINACLQEGCDINESDYTGSTPLHLAIEYNNYKLFSQLLEKGASTKIFAKGCAPLHLAAKNDLDGRFITDLIEAGADVNSKSNNFARSRLTPLESAIKHKNLKAIELLLKEKAFVSYENRLLLESDLKFSSIQHLLPKKISQLQGFDAIIDHIEKGDCVVLGYPENPANIKFQKSLQLEKEGKLIQIIVNPETRLLEDGNYEEISDISDCTRRVALKKDLDKVPDSKITFGY